LKQQQTHYQQPQVLVTRPAHQAKPLLMQLQQQGFEAIPFAVIEICDVPPSDALIQQLKHLEQYALLIFISANAVHKGMDCLQTVSASITQPVLAIGAATAKALKHYNVTPLTLKSQQFDSETLLEHPALQGDNIQGKKILIFRGQAGREVLADNLRKRGAMVEYAAVYRRQKAQQDSRPLLQHWQTRGIDLITVSSNEALQNLYDMLGMAGRDILLKTAIIVPSTRCVQLAQQLGFTADIMQATSAADEAVLSAVKKWQQQHITS